jgi:hypothetical protein
MPINFWIDPNDDCLFHWRFTGRWTTSRYITLNEQAYHLVRERSPQPVDVIVDLCESAAPPPGMLMHIVTSDAQWPSNWRVSVLVTKSVMIGSLINLARHMSENVQQRYRVAESIDEAYGYIQSLRDNADAETALD